MEDKLTRRQYLQFSRELGTDLLANPMLSQKFCSPRAGIMLATRRNPSTNSIGDVHLFMSHDQRMAAGGTFKWHPFYNALRLNGWTETKKEIWGILAGGYVEYTKELEMCTWTLRLNDHPNNWAEYANVRWDMSDEAKALQLWTFRATLYLPTFTPYRYKGD